MTPASEVLGLALCGIVVASWALVFWAVFSTPSDRTHDSKSRPLRGPGWIESARAWAAALRIRWEEFVEGLRRG